MTHDMTHEMPYETATGREGAARPDRDQERRTAPPGRSVLISGASVAGPALAYWLGRYGFRPTVIELAPALRGGGFAVDFRGAAQLTVLERMGVLDDIRAHSTGGGDPLTFIDGQGRPLAAMPPEFSGGEVEILRSELSRILHRHSLTRPAATTHPAARPGTRPPPSTFSATPSPPSPRPPTASMPPSNGARRAPSTW